ncbi:MAG: adenine deaminase [Candidatus Bathyarchaeota archaeon]|nr:adenine deaminase [Candidatus Bathyarchaeota archaeon]
MSSCRATLEELIKVCKGERNATLLLENCCLVNVFTGEIHKASIGVYKDRIAYIAEKGAEGLKAEEHVDLNGRYVSPGFIDSHIHIESSMVTPRRLAEAILPRGVTCLAADPHEIANVLGTRGVEVMAELSRNLPLKIYLWIPTCIPSVLGVETAGAEIYAGDIASMLSESYAIGLGEVMDYLGLLRLDRRILDIVKVGRSYGKVIDGHAPLLSGRLLDGYISAGINADHEIFSFEEALEKVRRGLYVKIRRYLLESSGFVEGVKRIPDRGRLLLATDDTPPDILESDGHMDVLLRRAVELGLDPVEAIQAATIRPALHLRLNDLGAIAPGRIADIVVLESLEKFKVKRVYIDGRLTVDDGRLVVPIESKPPPSDVLNTVKIGKLSIDDFKVKAPIVDGYVEARILRVKGLETEIFTDKLRVKYGVVDPGRYTYVAVVERHGRGGGLTVGFIDGIGLREGAIASTVAHDSHNIVVVGRKLDDIIFAVDKLREIQGGYIAVRDGEILAMVKLPIAGLMSDEPVSTVAGELRRFREAEYMLGVEDPYPIPMISLLALPVIPHARITDKGIYDVDKGELLSVIVRYVV